MKTFSRTITALALLAAAAHLWAIGQGRVTGKVTDSSGAGLEGVTVTLTTPALRNFKISVTTDKAGQYGLIVNDATLHYHMKFEKAGYQTSERDEKFKISEPTIVDEKLVKGSEGPAPKGAAPAAGGAPKPSDVAAKAYNDGVDAWNAGDKDTAEKKFLEAVSKNPDLPQAWQLLARRSYEKKDWAKTLEYGQKALDLDPAATDLYSMLFTAASNSGDKKGAEEWRKKFEEANPDTPEIIYNKGVEALNKKKIKDAEGFFEKAVAAKPEFALAHYQLGLVSFNLSKKAAAREHLQKYLELEPQGSEAATAKELLDALK